MPNDSTAFIQTKWGNNDYHYPQICEGCESYCPICSNGPRLEEYRRAQAENRLKYEVI